MSDDKLTSEIFGRNKPVPIARTKRLENDAFDFEAEWDRDSSEESEAEIDSGHTDNDVPLPTKPHPSQEAFEKIDQWYIQNRESLVQQHGKDKKAVVYLLRQGQIECVVGSDDETHMLIHLSMKHLLKHVYFADFKLSAKSASKRHYGLYGQLPRPEEKLYPTLDTHVDVIEHIPNWNPADFIGRDAIGSDDLEHEPNDSILSMAYQAFDEVTSSVVRVYKEIKDLE